MYGTPPTLPSVKTSPPVAQHEAVEALDLVEETQAAIANKWTEAATNLEAAKTQYKKYYEQGNVTKEKCIRQGDFVYVKNQRRQSSLDPYFLGPFEVLSVEEPTVTVRSERRGPLTIHKNNVRVSQPTDVVVLPSADLPQDQVGIEEINDPAEDGEVVVVDLLQEGEVEGAVAGEVDPLQLPIALRKPHRHKPKGIGKDFVPR